MAMMMGLLAVWGWVLASQPWYSFKPLAARVWLQGQYSFAAPIPELSSLNAWQLTLPHTAGNPLSPNSALTSFLGMPLPVTLLLAGVALSVIGVFAKSGLFPVVGLIVLNFARSVVSFMDVGISNPAFFGKFTQALSPLGEFQMVLWLAMGLSLLVAVQVGYANYLEKKKLKAQGVSSPSFLDSLWTMQSSAINRISSMDQQVVRDGSNNRSAP